MYIHSSPQVLCKADFDHFWQNIFETLDSRRQRIVQQFRPPDWFANDLLTLLEEHHEQPARQLAPIIRRFMVARNFVDESGDSIIDEHELEHLNVKVDFLVTVLESMRQYGRARGHWSDAPVTPQMFG